MLAYIDAIGQTNKQLVFALKPCAELLANIRPTLPDKEGWQDILDDFQKIMRVRESIVREEDVH